MQDWVRDRRRAIVRLARERGPVAISDLRAVAPFWSAETLRLDCAHLVRLGELEPHGDRRWRRYVATGQGIRIWAERGELVDP